MSKLTSTEISTKSPLSISGFTTRYLRVTSSDSTAMTAVFAVPRWTVLIVMWALLLVWNVLVWTVFFWFTIIWRAYRNSRRRDKKQSVQHQELLAALGKQNQ